MWPAGMRTQLAGFTSDEASSRPAPGWANGLPGSSQYNPHMLHSSPHGLDDEPNVELCKMLPPLYWSYKYGMGLMSTPPPPPSSGPRTRPAPATVQFQDWLLQVATRVAFDVKEEEEEEKRGGVGGPIDVLLPPPEPPRQARTSLVVHVGI